MKKLIQIVLISGIISGCSKADLIQPEMIEEPSAVNMSCLASPSNTIRREEYEYSNGRVISSTSFSLGALHTKTETTYIYNETNQLIKIIYKIIYYDSNGNLAEENEFETLLEYQNDQLVKETYFWGGFSTYEYKNDRFVKRIDFTGYGTEHHISRFNYVGDLITQEIKETAVGSVIFERFYYYDLKKRLVKITENDQVIEENKYAGNRLIEKRIYYFGIDPGFDICYGNYLYRYEY